jgi:hypothetical protein
VRQKYGIEVGSLILEKALPGSRSSGLEKSEETIMIFIILE